MMSNSNMNTNNFNLFNSNTGFGDQQQQHQQQHQQQQHQNQQQQQQQQREKLPSFLFSSSAANNANLNNRPSTASSIASVTTPSAVTTPGDPDLYNDESQNTSNNNNNSPWPFANQQQQLPRSNQTNIRSQGIAFNDRLRMDSNRSSYNANNTLNNANNNENSNLMAVDNDPFNNAQHQRTPSRLPPSKSLLDSGTPSIMQLRPPTTPGSFARPSSSTPSTTPNNNNLTSTTPRFISSVSPYNNSNPNTPGDNNNNNESLSKWITVFGFSGSETESQALREFRRHGDIARTIPGKGNWIHILYRTQLQAQVALYRPWRILTGTDIMIGVVPCTEPELAKHEDEVIEKGFLLASPANSLPNSNNNNANRNLVNTPINQSQQSPAVVARMKSPGTGLRTPSDLLRREGRIDNNTPNSTQIRSSGIGISNGTTQPSQTIVQTPQRQTSIFDYISSFYK